MYTISILLKKRGIIERWEMASNFCFLVNKMASNRIARVCDAGEELKPNVQNFIKLWLTFTIIVLI